MTNSRYKNSTEEMKGYIDRTKTDRHSRVTYSLSSAEISALADMFFKELRDEGIEWEQAICNLIDVSYDYGFSKGVRAMRNKSKRQRKERKA